MSEEHKHQPAPEDPADASPPAPQENAAVEDVDDGREVHKIPGQLYRELVGMGFSENAVKKAFISGCINQDTVLQWLQMHEGHPELDTDIDPNVRVVLVEKKELTPEQLAEQVAVMKRKIEEHKKKAALDEAERDRKRELQRIADGRAMRDAKEERERKQRMEAYEEVKKQKLADAAAKERVEIQLAIDKKVRKGIDPEEARKEATAEMEEKKKRLEQEKQKRLEEERQAREEEAKRRAEAPTTASNGGWNIAAVLAPGPDEPAASAPAAALPPAPEPSVSELPAPNRAGFLTCIAQIRAAANIDDGVKQVCIDTLTTIIGNILKQPLEQRFRSLKRSSAVFNNKLAPLPGAVAFLMLAGFRSDVSPEGQPVMMMRSCILHRLQAAAEALGQTQ